MSNEGEGVWAAGERRPAARPLLPVQCCMEGGQWAWLTVLEKVWAFTPK